MKEKITLRIAYSFTCPGCGAWNYLDDYEPGETAECQSCGVKWEVNEEGCNE